MVVIDKETGEHYIVRERDQKAASELRKQQREAYYKRQYGVEEEERGRRGFEGKIAQVKGEFGRGAMIESRKASGSQEKRYLKEEAPVPRKERGGEEKA